MSRSEYDLTGLTNRIKEAKEKVRTSKIGDRIIVHNMDEILGILKSEKSLGTMIFVNHFIGREERSIEECVDYVCHANGISD